MDILLIGGTGTISMAISRRLLDEGHHLFLLNRGSRALELEERAKRGQLSLITVDINKDETEAENKLRGYVFDVVADFIAFFPEQLARDYRLFAGRTKQFVYISTASAYQKPPADYLVNEGTPLANPYWDYSRYKIEGENYLMKMYRENGFPVTIVRPSHTFDDRKVPIGLHGDKGSWQVLQRMLEGKPVIIPGDGTSLWTMTHNEDFAVGFTGLLGNPHAIGQAVQIMSDESMTWNQIHEVIAGALGVSLKAVHISSDFLSDAAEGLYDLRGQLLGDKAQSVVFDISKLKRLVPAFLPHPMAQRLAGCVQSVVSHPEYQTLDPEFDAWCDRVIAARETALQSLKNG